MAKIKAVDENDDAPKSKSPEREKSLGSAIYDAALPIVGEGRAADLAATARLVESVPQVVNLLRDTVRQQQPDAGSTVVGAPIPGEVTGWSAPKAAVLVLAAALSALVFAGALTLYLELRSIREAAVATREELLAGDAKLAERLARAEGASKAADDARQEQLGRIKTLESESIDQRHTIEVLTEHVVARLDAIGKRTGANKLEEWTKTPADLELVVVRRRAEQERARLESTQGIR